MDPMRFELMHLTILDLESSALNRSAKDPFVIFVVFALSLTTKIRDSPHINRPRKLLVLEYAQASIAYVHVCFHLRVWIYGPNTRKLESIGNT